MLHSDIADANNSPGNPGGITAALFLRPFAGGLPWAHLDIAGPARAAEDDGELSRGATGFGVRLLASVARRVLLPAAPTGTARPSGRRSADQLNSLSARSRPATPHRAGSLGIAGQRVDRVGQAGLEARRHRRRSSRRAGR